MSRTLARLRSATGDPLLVRAGRGLVPTPRAIQLRERVGAVRREVEALLGPAQELDLSRLSRTFTIRTSDGFVENFGAALLDRVACDAPGVTLRFMRKADKASGALREAAVDLETGIVGAATAPELRVQALFRDRFVGAVRDGHKLAGGPVDAAAFAAERHVLVSRRGAEASALDEALKRLGLERRIAAIVDGFAAALALARRSDLVATVPERHTRALRDGLHAFELPVDTPTLTISMIWHPRLDADPAHRWLRRCVRDTCAAPADRGSPGAVGE